MTVKIYNVGFNSIKITNIVTGPDFWTFKNAQLNNLCPYVADNSSFGTSSGTLNIGQQPFEDDPLGYSPYDTSYDPAYWQNGSYNSNDDTITPSNLSFSYYNKPKTSGKYYMEYTVGGSTAVGSVGLVPIDATEERIRDVQGHYGVFLGDYYNYTDKVSYPSTSLVRVEYGIQMPVGSLVQIWMDFDEGNMLIKLLGTTSDDYVSPVF